MHHKNMSRKHDKRDCMKLILTTLISLLITASVNAEQKDNKRADSYKSERAPDYFPYTNYQNGTRSNHYKHGRGVDYFPFTNRYLRQERVIVETWKGTTNIIVITKE